MEGPQCLDSGGVGCGGVEEIDGRLRRHSPPST